jgi:hypothetical protein
MSNVCIQESQVYSRMLSNMVQKFCTIRQSRRVTLVTDEISNSIEKYPDFLGWVTSYAKKKWFSPFCYRMAFLIQVTVEQFGFSLDFVLVKVLFEPVTISFELA